MKHLALGPLNEFAAKIPKRVFPFIKQLTDFPIGQSCGVFENNEAIRRPYFLLRQSFACAI